MINIKPTYLKKAKPGEARHTLNEDKKANDILGWIPKIDLVDYIKTI
jgi:hypothetical protein